MIIIGYQGVGKSTLSKENINFIDLESSHFFIDGKRDDNWYLVYCSIAKSLSEQGYNVFVSSHDVVRNTLESIAYSKILIIYPSVDLKNDWVKKLEDRYNLTKLEKDYKAMMNAKDRYEDNIKELENSSFIKVKITDINYELKELIDEEKEDSDE